MVRGILQFPPPTAPQAAKKFLRLPPPPLPFSCNTSFPQLSPSFPIDPDQVEERKRRRLAL
jgi:hypothetical protein